MFFDWFNKKKQLEQDNVELAKLVSSLLRAIEDGKVTPEEMTKLKKEAYDVVIKYDL
jgi:hypothetical protein